MKNLKDTILGEIKEGKVAMTPRIYITLKLITLVLIATAIVLVTIFIFNFIVFSIRINGNDALLGFGPRGYGAFLWFFPWHLLVLDCALIVLLQHFIRRFRIGYQIPVLYVIGALLVFSFTIGFIIDRATPFNDRIHERRAHLPGPMRAWYDGARKHPQKGSGICRCTILAIDGSKLIVEDTRDATTTLTIVLPQNDRYATSSHLNVGDVVFIAGEEVDGIIRAFGVRKEGEMRLRHLPN